MPFDGIVSSAIAWELNQRLVNGKIDKIYQPEKDEIIMLIRANANNYKLLISSSNSYPRIHLTTESKNNPQTPPNFCMFLRKHIQGGKIAEIKQNDFERIIEIKIEAYNELGFPKVKKMIVEIMGKHSNIILVDEESNKILDSIKKVSIDVSRLRQILPGLTYVYPPSQNKICPLDLSMNLFTEKINSENKAVYKALYQSFQGLSPFISLQLCNLTGIDEDLPINMISDEKKSELYYKLRMLMDDIKNHAFQPCILSDSNGKIVDFYVLSKWIPSYYELQNFDSISKTVEAFYLNKDTKNRLKQKSANLHKQVNSILDKLGLKKQKLIEEILQAEKADKFRLYGELINANLYQINKNVSIVTLENYYNPGEMIDIPMNPLLTPSENAQRYFKKYNKAKTTYREKKIQLEETNKELSYFESVFQNIENAQSSEDIEEIRQELIDEKYIRKRSTKRKEKKIQSHPLNFKSSDGFTILVGKNNKQNDILTLKTASKHDIWLHTKEIPGSHVIILTQGKEVSEKAIYEAAALAAYHSKAKMSENVPVDYTLVKNVHKPSSAKPGMVIYDHYNTVYVNPSNQVG